MKELTSYNRVAGYLNKVFDLLNNEFFEGALSRPTITIQSTPKAYGHFTLSKDTWVSKLGETHEINIGAGTLSRPIENVCATLLHEMVHYFNYENGIQDLILIYRTWAYVFQDWRRRTLVSASATYVANILSRAPTISGQSSAYCSSIALT